MRGEINASGINPEQTAHEALEELLERVKACEDEQLNTEKENSSKQEKEKLADDELRHKTIQLNFTHEVFLLRCQQGIHVWSLQL